MMSAATCYSHSESCDIEAWLPTTWEGSSLMLRTMGEDRCLLSVAL